MKTILFPTDFSTNSTHSARYAGLLAKRLNAKIVLLHVYNFPMTTEIDAYSVEALSARSREDARDNLQLFSENFIEDTGVMATHISQIIDYGGVSDVILDTATSTKADMIVMGTKGASNIFDRWIGTNAEAVMKKAECPVWIIPQNAPVHLPQTVMYAADFEDNELAATHKILNIIETLGATCEVVHIHDYFAVNVGQRIETTAKELKNEFKNDDVTIHNLKRSEVIDGLDTYIRTHKPDVLALATHDKPFWTGLLEPSITKHFVQEAKLPMLIFKK